MARCSGSCASLETKRILTVDSKGRVRIPSDLQRSFGIAGGSAVELRFSLDGNYLLLLGTDSSPQAIACGKGAEPGMKKGGVA